jgi:hypothetical protein
MKEERADEQQKKTATSTRSNKTPMAQAKVRLKKKKTNILSSSMVVLELVRC